MLPFANWISGLFSTATSALCVNVSSNWPATGEGETPGNCYCGPRLFGRGHGLGNISNRDRKWRRGRRNNHCGGIGISCDALSMIVTMAVLEHLME